MLQGRMMHFPLSLAHLYRRMRDVFPKSEVVWRGASRDIRRQTFAQACERATRLGQAMTRLGVKPGTRVATLCWNHTAHFEAYMGIPLIGAVVHTLNVRLHPTELAYIANHAEDEILIVDRSQLELWDKFRGEVKSIREVIVVPDDGPVSKEMGYDYEAVLAAERGGDPAFVELDENAAAMICYTSGTTGKPKGVVYSHRSCVLHSLMMCMRDTVRVSESEVLLPGVQLYHGCGWGLPYAAALSGAKLVLPGRYLDAESLLELVKSERVTICAGVPTIWLPMLFALDENPKAYDVSSLHTIICAGSAAPPSMIDGFANRHDVEVVHTWGMTELNPLGTFARVKTTMMQDSAEARRVAHYSQGLAAPLVEVRHRSDAGVTLPWDSKSMGELETRGPFVAQSYFGDEGADKFTSDGWFRTGDVVTIDPNGYVTITDRSKDVVKSGGEWISSVALENALMGHPAVAEAAVFAAVHRKWDERPVAAVVLKPKASATPEDLAAHLAPHFVKYWLPDKYIFMEQIPRTSTGKFLKSKLRAEYGNCLLDDAASA